MSRVSVFSADGANRPRFNTPSLRDTSTNRRSGKSHTAFGLRRVDISLRTIFLPVTFFTTQSTLGSRHEALFQRISITLHGTLAITLAFASLAFAIFSTLALLLPLWVVFLLSLSPCHGMIHQCFAQPTLLSDHQVQGLQSKARNHVLASLDSKCHEPPCTPDRLRTSSYQKCTLLPRMNQEHQGPTHPDGSSQTLQPGGFPDQHPLPVVILFGWVWLPRGFVQSFYSWPSSVGKVSSSQGSCAKLPVAVDRG